jgi:hypothetical protein
LGFLPERKDKEQHQPQPQPLDDLDASGDGFAALRVTAWFGRVLRVPGAWIVTDKMTGMRLLRALVQGPSAFCRLAIFASKTSHTGQFASAFSVGGFREGVEPLRNNPPWMKTQEV